MLNLSLFVHVYLLTCTRVKQNSISNDVRVVKQSHGDTSGTGTAHSSEALEFVFLSV